LEVNGDEKGRKRVCGGSAEGLGMKRSGFVEGDEAVEGVEVDAAFALEEEMKGPGKPFSTILRMFKGVSLFKMTVATPAAVANSAAINLVCIPPVPKSDPRVERLTGRERFDSVEK